MVWYYPLPLAFPPPPKRRRTVLWNLADYVAYRLQQRHTLNSHDYYDFLRRAKWKLQQATRWHEKVGNYLRVLKEVPLPGTATPDHTRCAVCYGAT